MVKRYDKFGDEALQDSWPVYVEAADYDAIAKLLREIADTLDCGRDISFDQRDRIDAVLRPTDSGDVKP